MAQSVKVCCRFRPVNKRELATDPTVTCTVDQARDVTLLPEMCARSGQSQYSFDYVLDPEQPQSAVYEHTTRPLVDEVFRGYNITIFAYGQTGSGKTHTMMGDPESEVGKGIVPRLVEDIFDHIEEADVNVEFTLKCSNVEIYNEKVRDLLDPRKDNLRIREKGNDVYIEGVTEQYVSDISQVLDLLSRGSGARAVASTQMNDESSRSHSVLILRIEQKVKTTGSRKAAKLVLVDLAGSEKILKTGAQGQTLKEAQHINKSLSALGNVISALTRRGGGKGGKGVGHVPYRDSKLTRLLSDSLGGNSKTCLIITCSPSAFNLDETVSTLRFGQRAKRIQNKPVVNAERSVAEYKLLLEMARRKMATQQGMIMSLEAYVIVLCNLIQAHGLAVPRRSAELGMPARGSKSIQRDLEEGGVGGTESDGEDYFVVEEGETDEHGLAVGAVGDKEAGHGEESAEEELEFEAELQIEAQQAENREQKLEELERENTTLREQLSEQTSAGATATSELSSTKERCALLAEQGRLASEQVEALRARTSQLEADVKRQRERADETVKDLHALRVRNRDESAARGQRGDKVQDATRRRYDELIEQLERKCQQHAQLQDEFSGAQRDKQNTARELAAAQQALQRTTLQLQLAAEDKIKAKALETKLAAAEALCKKLLESGLYWRQQREQTKGNIATPISGGGKKKRRARRDPKK